MNGHPVQILSSLICDDDAQQTRMKLLELRSNARNHWISLILAYHLGGNYSPAVDTIDSYLRTQDLDTDEGLKKFGAFELSELLLYRAQILDESGDMDGALRALERDSRHILDKLSMREAQGVHGA